MRMNRFGKKCAIFLNEIRKTKTKDAASNHFFNPLCFFTSWYLSLSENSNPLSDERPWITFAAANFLEKQLRRTELVFEYGSGGSTLFFAKRVNYLVSVEHDQEWAQKVSSSMCTKKLTNWKYYIIEPSISTILEEDYTNPLSYASTSRKYQRSSFANYAKVIDEYPNGYFDVVLIDGRARPSCFYHSVRKVKKGGFLILDNADRPHYDFIHRSLSNVTWRKFDFYGPGPYNNYFWQTCIWQRIIDDEDMQANLVKAR